MNPTIQGGRPPSTSMPTVYRRIEEDGQASGRPDARPTRRPDPFDAILVHRLLDLVPGDPVLVVAAIARTGGASPMLGPCHSRVRGTWAVADPASWRAVSALRDHPGRRGTGGAPLGGIERPELPERLAGRPGAVVLADAQAQDAADLAGAIARWLDPRPDVRVLVSGLGRVGQCPAIATLMNLCTTESGLRFHLLRELDDALMASRLALVARRDDPGIDDVLDRLRRSYSGQGRYLDLLHMSNERALREARIDDEVLRDNWTFAPLSAEIEALKRQAREADERTATAARALFEATTFAGRLAKIRRRLSATPLGGAWRMAKRVRRKVALRG